MSIVTATVKYGARDNPNFKGMNAYTVKLSYQGRSMTVPFYMGLGHTKGPTAQDVLESLLMDASGDTADFHEWASDYGYDDDSRSARATWRAVRTQTAKLKHLLGADYAELEDSSDPEEFAKRMTTDPSGHTRTRRRRASAPSTHAAAVRRARRGR